jgi:hypothetical protein
MESIGMAINNKYSTTVNQEITGIIRNNQEREQEKDIDVEDRGSSPEGAKSVSPPASGSSAISVSGASASQDHQSHGHHVSSFLKFSIQNILQHAAASNGASAAAAAVAAAASRRSSDLMAQSDMAAAVMSELDMKRAVGTLPFW